MKLGRKLIISIVLISLTALVSCIVYSYPRNINKSFKGVKYRLGVKNNSYIENIDIRFEGKYSKSIISVNKFKGKIYIGDIVIPHERGIYIPRGSDEIVIEFDKYNGGLITYSYYDENRNRGQLYSLGSLYVSNEFDKITICIIETKDEMKKTGDWNGGDGLMISAPATNREEGLSISNELMKPINTKWNCILE